MIRTRTFVLVVLALFAHVAHAVDHRLEVFDLKHRPAAQIAPIVQPLLNDGEAVQAHGFELILRAAPGTIEQVRSLVQRLDRVPQRLLVSVRQSDTAQTAERDAEARLTARPGHSSGSVRAYATNDREQGAVTQQIQVLEGNAAFISFGQSVPTNDRTVIIGPGGTAVQDSSRYRDVTSGFYVLPQVTGDLVHLQISPHRDTLSRDGGGIINTQRADTVVESRLGQWIEIGGTVERRSDTGEGIVYSTRGRTEQQGRIEVKVDLLH